jgi:hypothetical protein
LENIQILPIPTQSKPVGVGPGSSLSSRRFSPKERLVRAEHLDLTYGHRCFYCGTECSEPYTVKGPKRCLLEEEHYNGDPTDNRLTNFRWGCRSCNLARRSLANHSSRLVSGGVSEAAAREELVEDLEMVRYSHNKEDRWISELRSILADGPRPNAWLRGNLAKRCDISVKTHDRYLEKNASAAPTAEFRRFKESRGGPWMVDLRRAPEN